MAVFPTTQWTRILEAQATSARAAVAWQELLLRYWQPLYVFFRAKGLSPSDAQDAVQGFSLELMEHETLFKMTPERGRLRGFLKVAAENFLLHQYEKSQAAKRGGGLRPIPIDEANAERWASSDAPPDAAFERAWALSVFQRALSRLESEWASRKSDFSVVRAFFSGESAAPSYQEVAATYGVSIPQLKSMLHRARARFRELVEEEVVETVGDASNVAEEMSLFLSVLSQ